MNVSHKPPAGPPAKPPVTFSSREFNQDTARAKRAAKSGPVFITDRGAASHVLMTVEDYERLKNAEPPKPFQNLADALAQKEGGDFDFDIPEFKGRWSLRIPDLD